MAMRVLGIGPVGSLVASGKLKPREREWAARHPAWRASGYSYRTSLPPGDHVQRSQRMRSRRVLTNSIFLGLTDSGDQVAAFSSRGNEMKTRAGLAMLKCA